MALISLFLTIMQNIFSKLTTRQTIAFIAVSLFSFGGFSIFSFLGATFVIKMLSRIGFLKIHSLELAGLIIMPVILGIYAFIVLVTFLVFLFVSKNFVRPVIVIIIIVLPWILLKVTYNIDPNGSYPYEFWFKNPVSYTECLKMKRGLSDLTIIFDQQRCTFEHVYRLQYPHYLEFSRSAKKL